MSEIIQWINDSLNYPLNYPLDTRWEDLPVELRVPTISRTCVVVNAKWIECMLEIQNMDGTLAFPTPRDAVVSHLLAFTPRAECWVGRVRVGTMAELFDDTYDEPADSDSEPLPEDPAGLEAPPEGFEPPQFWSEEDHKENAAEWKEIEQELASDEWDRLHSEERCPPRE